MSLVLDDNVRKLSGVGESVFQKLERLNLRTVRDLILNLPRRFDDFSNLQTIATVKPGHVTLKAKIIEPSGRYSHKGTHITEAIASDNTASVRLVWFNQSYRAQSIKRGREYFISGDFQLNYQRLSIINPSIELVSDFPVNSARIVPVYAETKGLKSAKLRKYMYELLPLVRSLPETLPASTLAKQKLISRAEAYEIMHFPKNLNDLSAAKMRLGFEEVFRLTLASLLNKNEAASEKSLSIKFNDKLAKEFVSHLPFKLTPAQRVAIWQIYQDMQKPQPMNRLVEGDVGSGKTVVAAMASVMVMKLGYQVALMAPTELLARQHVSTVSELFKPLGMDGQVSLLTGNMSTSKKKTTCHRIKTGKASLLIGTHALIQEGVDMHKLGLVIIDEQHRFGVDQRKRLLQKAGHAPHVLTMTATPIPRSLALTLYGELDVSIIDTKPVGRQLVETRLVPEISRKKLYITLEEELNKGRQAFIVCPLVSESDVLDVNSAEVMQEKLSKSVFEKWRIGLLHGKLSSNQKNSVMRDFVKGKYHILVSTTIIEVGVDIPNATVMIIENSERFGLAQIHQLRGRIGRGEHKGTCYLMYDGKSNPTKRLRAVASSNDGFKLAELDLEIRGPGAIYGTSQHGELDMRIAKLTDIKLISQARQAAQDFIDTGENLLQYGELAKHVQKLRKVTNLN